VVLVPLIKIINGVLEYWSNGVMLRHDRKIYSTSLQYSITPIIKEFYINFPYKFIEPFCTNLVKIGHR